MAPRATLLLALVGCGCVEARTIELPSLENVRSSVLFISNDRGTSAFAIAEGELRRSIAVSDSDALELWSYSCGLERLGLAPGPVALDEQHEPPEPSATWRQSEGEWLDVEPPDGRPWIVEPSQSCAPLLIQAQALRPGSVECAPDFAVELGVEHWMLGRNCFGASGAAHFLDVQERSAGVGTSTVTTLASTSEWYAAVSDGVYVWLVSASSSTAFAPNFARARFQSGQLTIEPRAPIPRQLQGCRYGCESPGVVCTRIYDVALAASLDPARPEIDLVSECGVARYAPDTDSWQLLYATIPQGDLPSAGLVRLDDGELFVAGVDANVLHFVDGNMSREPLGGAPPTTAALGLAGEVYVGDYEGGLWLWRSTRFEKLGVMAALPLQALVPIELGVLGVNGQHSIFQYKNGDMCLDPPFSLQIPAIGAVRKLASIGGQTITLVESDSDNDPTFFVLEPPPPLERCNRR